MAQIKYLYGAAVQGIQSFIFQTNKLKEIVGASELVYDICTTFFDSFSTNGEVIQRAAGCVKHIFDNKEACASAVLNFPRKVMESAPGITVSQAVVRFEDMEQDRYREDETGKIYLSFRSAVNELEQRLRIQRNCPVRSVTCGLMGIRRSRATGLPVIAQVGREYFDIATDKMRKKSGNANQKLCESNFNKVDRERVVFDINKMTGFNAWIAIVHIDGNGLGQIVQAIGTHKDNFKDFSHKLEDITICSTRKAFHILDRKYDFRKFIPMRPIVLSGDDHTLICRADLAVEYVEAFFKTFEAETKKQLGDILSEGNLAFDHLTACAGIAFVKSSFPFHYGYRLAEELCSRAKADAKLNEHKINELPRSCLMFHKVQDSSVEDYNTIVMRELIPWSGLTFEFGPYYMKENLSETEKRCLTQRWSIEELKESLKYFDGKDGNAIKSNLRQWLILLHKGPAVADLKLERLKSMITEESKDQVSKITTPISGRIPVYDLLVLYTMLNQKIKEVDHGIGN